MSSDRGGDAATRRRILETMIATGTLPLLRGSAGATSVADPGPAVRIRDFLNSQQRAAVIAGIDPPDCTAAFISALATGHSVTVDAGTYGIDALRLPNGARLTGDRGAILQQASAQRPALHCVSDERSGQLAQILVEGLTIVGHPQARSAAVLLEAHGGYAIWRSRFSFFAQKTFCALQVEASDDNNVFECEMHVVSEESSDTAVLVRGGVYNQYHLFLTRTRGWALDDASASSMIRVVAENCVIFRGQTNQIAAHVEGISAPRAASEVAVTDRGFGNIFIGPQVNMPAADRGKLRYAYKAFERTLFLSPQILGPGAPPHPFAPTSNQAFTIIGGRSNAANTIEATFDNRDPDHDRRNVTFIGDGRDYTTLPTHPAARRVQRVVATPNAVIQIAADTQILLLDPAGPLQTVGLLFDGMLAPIDSWQLTITTTAPIERLSWPSGSRYARLPTRISPGSRLHLVYQRGIDRWIAA